MDWRVVILAVVLLAVMVAGLSVKLIFKKNGRFAGTCASQSPFLNESGESCSLCGAKPDEQCKNS
ncbi:MAG: membrane or secreted protein [Flavobacteriales bacterium]|nr:membrane or secreted protein [Flavobacteriales bacterium]MCZ2442222.1 membrane or secreted protein [Flavobacteriales bacterium]